MTSYTIIPKATMKDGKYLAEGLFSLDYNRLVTKHFACGYGARLGIAALRGKEHDYGVNYPRPVTLTRTAIKRLVNSTESNRVLWVAQRLLSNSSKGLTHEEYAYLSNNFGWYPENTTRDKLELVFAMLEVVARRRGMLPSRRRKA